MPLAIVLILSFSMNKACQEILRAIALPKRADSKLRDWIIFEGVVLNLILPLQK